MHLFADDIASAVFEYPCMVSLQDILSVRQNLSVLNGPIARMTALVSVIFAELTIIGKADLVNSTEKFIKAVLLFNIVNSQCYLFQGAMKILLLHLVIIINDYRGIHNNKMSIIRAALI